MEPITASILIPAAVSLISGFVQQGNNAAAQKAIEDLVNQYGPDARGLIEKELGGPGALSQIYGEKLAPEAASAQREALRRMQQVAAGGYTPEEEASLRNIQAQTAAMAASQQAGLQSQLQRQGVLDSGARIAMQQAAGQAAANRAGQQGLNVAAEAQRRAFQAMQGLGQMGTSVRGQSFEEARTRAAAEEARQLNRARMGMDVYGQELSAKTGLERQGAAVANAPWEQASQAAGVAGQTWAGYEGAKKKKGQ